MNRKLAAIFILLLAVLGVLAYFSLGGRAPSGQPPLESLTASNVTDVESAFNAAKDDVRVLMLLSPT